MVDDPRAAIERKIITGYAYVSGNGQLVLDQHPTDEEHLLAPQTRESQPLYDCRVYLSDLFPKEWLGKLGKFTVHRVTDDRGEAIAVQVTFKPKAGGTPPG